MKQLLLRPGVGQSGVSTGARRRTRILLWCLAPFLLKVFWFERLMLGTVGSTTVLCEGTALGKKLRDTECEVMLLSLSLNAFLIQSFSCGVSSVMATSSHGELQ